MRFGDSKISWTEITNDIINFYAPKIPFNYLEIQKSASPVSTHKASGFRTMKALDGNGLMS
jgi:hypothetical protein